MFHYGIAIQKVDGIKNDTIEYYDDLPKDFTGIVEWRDGTKTWHSNGKYHREDGPAIELNDDRGYGWWLNGEHLSSQKYWKRQKNTINAQKIMIYILGSNKE